MNRKNQLMLALWMTTLHLTTGSGAFKVSLQPKAVMKHVNESLELVCAVTGCPSDAEFTWKIPTDKSVGGGMESNGTTSLKVYSHLTTEDEKTVVCQAKCGTMEQDKTRIQVYSFPSDPVISRMDESTLTCTVLSAYPPERFELHWMRGDDVLTGGEGTFNYRAGVQDVSFVYTPKEEDLGKNLTCRVTLNLDGIPEDRKVRWVTVQYGPAFLTVSSNATVKIGERVELRCDTDVKSSITWKLGQKEVTLLNRNKVLVIENATWSHAGVYECEASTELASRRSTVGLTVQGPPNVPKLRLSHAADPTAGDNVTITCESDSIPPAQLRLFRPSLNMEEEKQSSVSINIPSIQLKHSGLFYCEAQNELGSARSSINVTVRAPPRNSTVLVYPSSQVMEGQNVTVNCSTLSFPPASIALTREADGFEFQSPNGIFQLLNLQFEQKGTYKVTFTNELGNEVQTFEITVKAQQSITPILTKTAIPVVSSVSLLTAAALLARYLRKAKKNSGGIDLGEALDM